MCARSAPSAIGHHHQHQHQHRRQHNIPLPTLKSDYSDIAVLRFNRYQLHLPSISSSDTLNSTLPSWIFAYITLKSSLLRSLHTLSSKGLRQHHSDSRLHCDPTCRLFSTCVHSSTSRLHRPTVFHSHTASWGLRSRHFSTTISLYRSLQRVNQGASRPARFCRISQSHYACMQG